MEIVTLISHHDAHQRKNELIDISRTRVLTEEERSN